MARTRTIKPGFFMNEELAELSCEARLLFIGLWTIADREGRLEDRPRKIKAAVFPYDDCDVERLLGLLEGKGFLNRYRVNGLAFLKNGNFIKHQKPHPKEAPSEIPAPGDEIRRSHNHGGPGGHNGSASHGPSAKHPGSANYEDDHGNGREKVELSHEKVEPGREEVGPSGEEVGVSREIQETDRNCRER